MKKAVSAREMVKKLNGLSQVVADHARLIEELKAGAQTTREDQLRMRESLHRLISSNTTTGLMMELFDKKLNAIFFHTAGHHFTAVDLVDDPTVIVETPEEGK
jgi:hypothetical protein